MTFITYLQRKSAKKQVIEGNLKSEDYYNNIYAADTLVSNEFSNAVDYDDALAYQNIYNNYNYYDNFSYSSRLRNFYGGSFYPYWRDPFYNSWYPSLYFGYGGYNSFFYDPYFYDPFSYNPYYYDYGYYGGGYGGYYGGGYGGYYGGGYGGYGGYYGFNPYYSYRNEENNVPYVRRERQSNFSSRWNTPSPVSASSRRDGYFSNGLVSGAPRRSATGTQTVGLDARKAASSSATSRMPYTNQSKSEQIGNRNVNSPTTKSTTISRPDYNSVNRTYTPSYNNPRMPTRPSYNNSRVGNESGSVRSQSYPGATKNNIRNNSSVSPGQTRTTPSYNNSRSYSAPSRSSSVGNSGSPRSYSGSGNYSNSEPRSYSSSSPSNSGSSSGGSSYSSGSSSREVSSGSSSSGRR
jgi:hypothetical protein